MNFGISNTSMKNLILSCVFFAITLTLVTGCNTISGIGRDVSNVGSDVSAGAKAVGRKMGDQ